MDYALAANLMQAEILTRYMEDVKIPIAAEHFAQICMMLADETINNATARKIIVALWEQDCDAKAYVAEHGLTQISDPVVLGKAADEAIVADERSVQAYLAGKDAAAQALIGKAIKMTCGKGNPRLIREIVMQKLLQKKTCSDSDI